MNVQNENTDYFGATGSSDVFVRSNGQMANPLLVLHLMKGQKKRQYRNQFSMSHPQTLPRTRVMPLRLSNSSLVSISLRTVPVFLKR